MRRNRFRLDKESNQNDFASSSDDHLVKNALTYEYHYQNRVYLFLFGALFTLHAHVNDGEVSVMKY